MKRTFAIAILLGGLCNASFAVILFSIEAPRDDVTARAGVCGRPELKPLHAAYWEFIQTRLFPLQRDEVAKVFGPKLDTATNWWGYGQDADGKRSGPALAKHPADFVLPLFAPGGGSNCSGVLMMMVSGLHSADPAKDKSHTDLHAVGDLGYVELYYQLDGERIQNAVICFRADNKFVPLASTNDFAKRLEWEKARFDALNKWLDEHMPKLTDLGPVDLAESSPSRLDLGGGKACILTTRVLHHPNVTNLWYEIDIRNETADLKEREKSYQSFSIDRPNESIGFSMDGNFYRLTPKLVEQLHEPNK